jgi:hypothetical protein
LVQDANNLGMVDTVFESDKSYVVTFNFFEPHAIRYDQKNKERSARQIHNTYRSLGTGPTKKDNFETLLTLINELQDQHSDDDLNTPALSKTANVCKVAQLTPEIRTTLAVEAKKWLLNELQCPQQYKLMIY